MPGLSSKLSDNFRSSGVPAQRCGHVWLGSGSRPARFGCPHLLASSDSVRQRSIHSSACELWTISLFETGVTAAASSAGGRAGCCRTAPHPCAPRRRRRRTRRRRHLPVLRLARQRAWRPRSAGRRRTPHAAKRPRPGFAETRSQTHLPPEFDQTLASLRRIRTGVDDLRRRRGQAAASGRAMR
jgi:hypothetical protein